MPKSIINNFNIDSSFWELNPQTIIIFNEFYEKDNSKNKIDSSKVMWAVALLVDPNDNNSFRFVEYKQKMKDIESG